MNLDGMPNVSFFNEIDEKQWKTMKMMKNDRFNEKEYHIIQYLFNRSYKVMKNDQKWPKNDLF